MAPLPGRGGKQSRRARHPNTPVPRREKERVGKYRRVPFSRAPVGMASVPTAERPPQGLNAYWLGAWRCALAVLKEQGTWAWEQKPLLDEYIFALRGAE